MATAIDGDDFEGVGQAVERQSAGEADDVSAIDQAAAKAALALGVLVEVDFGGVLPQAGGHHVLGFFHGHAVHMVDLFARLVIVPKMGAARQYRVVFGGVQIRRDHQIGNGDGRRQSGNVLGFDGGLGIALLDHHPTHIIHHHFAMLIGPGGTHIDDAGLLVGVFLEPDDCGHCGQRIAGSHRHPKAPLGIAKVGHRIERDIRHGFAEHHMERRHIVQRSRRQSQGTGEFIRRRKSKAVAVQRRIQGDIARIHRARRGMTDFLAEAEIFKEIA